MQWQEFIKDYLTFTRRERIAILAVLFIIIITALLPKLLNSSREMTPDETDSSWVSAFHKLEVKERENTDKSEGQINDETYAYQNGPPILYKTDLKPELFYFDPNTLEAEGWERLGLKEKNIRIIQNYLKKGGHFYKAEDLQKIYGLRQTDYERLAPFIKIKQPHDVVKEANNNSTSEQQNSDSSQGLSRHYAILDINTADTTEFISLPGIGSKLAARIVNFREKLGGFYSVSQIGETFGLRDSTFEKIKQYLQIKNFELRKININTATIDDLKAHPYIKWSLANPLIAFRNEHGPFGAIEDIRKIPSVTDAIFIKLSPYLKIQ